MAFALTLARVKSHKTSDRYKLPATTQSTGTIMSSTLTTLLPCKAYYGSHYYCLWTALSLHKHRAYTDALSVALGQCEAAYNMLRHADTGMVIASILDGRFKLGDQVHQAQGALGDAIANMHEHVIVPARAAGYDASLVIHNAFGFDTTYYGSAQ